MIGIKIFATSLCCFAICALIIKNIPIRYETTRYKSTMAALVLLFFLGMLGGVLFTLKSDSSPT